MDSPATKVTSPIRATGVSRIAKKIEKIIAYPCGPSRLIQANTNRPAIRWAETVAITAPMIAATRPPGDRGPGGPNMPTNLGRGGVSRVLAVIPRVVPDPAPPTSLSTKVIR